MSSTPSAEDRIVAVMSLSDERIREAVAGADPDDELSLERRLDEACVTGQQRDALDRVWGRRRKRFVQGCSFK